jgi:hypothetical protein
MCDNKIELFMKKRIIWPVWNVLVIMLMTPAFFLGIPCRLYKVLWHWWFCNEALDLKWSQQKKDIELVWRKRTGSDKFPSFFFPLSGPVERLVDLLKPVDK